MDPNPPLASLPPPEVKPLAPFSINAPLNTNQLNKNPSPPPELKVKRTTPAPLFQWTPFSISIPKRPTKAPTPTPAPGILAPLAPVVRTTTTTTTTTESPSGLCPRKSTIRPCKCIEPDPLDPVMLPDLNCSRAFSASDLENLRQQSGPGRMFNRIILRGSGISTLPPNAFGPHVANEYWILDNPNLIKIEEHAFGFQADPKKMILQNNKISWFPFKDLRRFPNLEYFVANGNDLVEIPDDAFNIAGGGMIDILLHENRITKIGKRAFANQNQLNAVTLHRNQLDDIKTEAFYFTGNVQTLSLGKNRIAKVDKEAFGGNVPRIIDMSENDLEELPREPWAYVLNGLSRMNEEAPENPATLLLTGNPLQCDCEMAWLYSMRDLFETSVDGIVCSELRFHRVSLFDLPEHHFFPRCA